MEFLRAVMNRGVGSSGFGSASTAEEVARGLSLDSSVVLITGASSGIGFEAAKVLVKHGAHVVVPARSIQQSYKLRDRILEEHPNARVTCATLDLSSLSSVREFVANFEALDLPLNSLINNAGTVSRDFKLSADGLELCFATNHMGHFLLTQLLLEKMVKTAADSGIEGRIVNVSSAGHLRAKHGILFESLNNKSSYNSLYAYAQSKLANVLFTTELSRRLQIMKANVTVNALHPGLINTNISRDYNRCLTNAFFFLVKMFSKDAKQGAATTVFVAVHPSLQGVSGKYFQDCNITESSRLSDTKLAKQLWDFSEDFVKKHSQKVET